jgi:hypothetical protein
VNGHPSLLPRHRGPIPVAWAIRAGDEEIGITFHRMDAELDTGPILAQRRYPLGELQPPEVFYPELGPVVAEALTEALAGNDTYWDRAEAVIHAVFRLAEQWPEFPMFVREAGRLGPDAFERFASVLDPLRKRAIAFLEAGMDQGAIRRQDPALLLFTLYTGVIGSLTEASVLNVVVGADKSRASLRRREREVIAFVRGALQPPP